MRFHLVWFGFIFRTSKICTNLHISLRSIEVKCTHVCMLTVLVEVVLQTHVCNVWSIFGGPCVHIHTSTSSLTGEISIIEANFLRLLPRQAFLNQK